MIRRLYFVVLLAIFAIASPAFAAAQQGSSSGDQFNGGDMYAGYSPLDGRPASFPGQGNPPKCIPPVNTWKLVAQKGSQCYYFAPDPFNGYITSINNVGALQKFYVKCGVDLMDQTKVLCQNPGDDLPGAPPTKGPPLASGISATGRNGEVFNGGDGGGNPGPSGGPGGTTNRGRPGPIQGGQQFNGGPNDPCHPYYNLSTAAGRAAMQQNAARDKEACDEERCKHNPQLEFCGGPPEPQSDILAIRPGGKTPVPAAVKPCPGEPLAMWMWTDPQTKTLKLALKNAKDMLDAVRPHVDAWDDKTRAIAQQWFGDQSAATRKAMLSRIDGSLTMIGNLTSQDLNGYIHPGSPFEKDPRTGATPIAYMHKMFAAQPTPHIWVEPSFWTYPEKEKPLSQATIVVHELSHYNLGGGTRDVEYGEGDCTELVLRATPVGSFLAPYVGEKPALPKDPMENADSYRLFIYDASRITK